MPTNFRFDAAVAATILGTIVSGTMWYLDRGQNELNRQKEVQLQRQQQLVDTGRYKQDLILELQTRFLEYKTLEDLQKLERSLSLLEKNGDNESNEIIAIFREQIVAELKSVQLQGPKKAARDSAVRSLENKIISYEQQIKKKKEADLAAVKAIPKLTVKPVNAKKIRLKSITCIDPQSNWPKRCDDIYFALDGDRLWKLPRSICRGETLILNDELPFSEESKLALMEHDRVNDDLLGEITISKQVASSKGSWIIDMSEEGTGRWHYEIEYDVSK